VSGASFGREACRAGSNDGDIALEGGLIQVADLAVSKSVNSSVRVDSKKHTRSVGGVGHA
jgi:hypothetical protein